MTNQDLIRQYVNIGIGITEHQYNRLSDNLKKSYIRKRLMNDPHYSEMQDWEFFQFSDDDIKKIKPALLSQLLMDSVDPLRIAETYIEKKGKDLNDTDVYRLCKFITPPDETERVSELILQAKGSEYISPSAIFSLMKANRNKTKILGLILDNFGSNLDDNHIRSIFGQTRDYKKLVNYEFGIKNLLLKYYSKDRLNKIIRDEKNKNEKMFDLELIP